jgi:hypothetical protein
LETLTWPKERLIRAIIRSSTYLPIQAEDEIETFISSLSDSLKILHIDMTGERAGERGDPEAIFESILVISSARKFKNLNTILWSPDRLLRTPISVLLGPRPIPTVNPDGP